MSAPIPSASAVRAARELRVVVGRLRRRLHESIDNQQLTATQISVISRLAKGGAATASTLATAERVRPQSVAATIAVLEERGLVRRTQDPDDGRRQLVTLTDAGRELFMGRRRTSEEWLTNALQERFSEEERKLVLEATMLLERLIEE